MARGAPWAGRIPPNVSATRVTARSQRNPRRPNKFHLQAVPAGVPTQRGRAPPDATARSAGRPQYRDDRRRAGGTTALHHLVGRRVPQPAAARHHRRRRVEQRMAGLRREQAERCRGPAGLRLRLDRQGRVDEGVARGTPAGRLPLQSQRQTGHPADQLRRGFLDHGRSAGDLLPGRCRSEAHRHVTGRGARPERRQPRPDQLLPGRRGG